MTILEFKPRDIVKNDCPESITLDYWLERNDIILANFPTMSYHEKQNTIEAVVGMNSDLYKLVLELKAEIKLMKGE